jgi:hypothetical protein
MAAEIDPKNVEALSELTHAIYFYSDCHLRFDEENPEAYKNSHERGLQELPRTGNPGWRARAVGDVARLCREDGKR